jgi:hypothetical protein
MSRAEPARKPLTSKSSHPSEPQSSTNPDVRTSVVAQEPNTRPAAQHLDTSTTESRALQLPLAARRTPGRESRARPSWDGGTELAAGRTRQQRSACFSLGEFLTPCPQSMLPSSPHFSSGSSSVDCRTGAGSSFFPSRGELTFDVRDNESSRTSSLKYRVGTSRAEPA